MSGREDFVLAVAEYLTMFETIGYVAQKTTVIEWLRYAPLVAKSRELRIPFILDSDDVPESFGELRDAKICSHALMSLLGKGYRWWTNCDDAQELSSVHPRAISL
jgi:hypothetical protein